MIRLRPLAVCSACLLFALDGQPLWAEDLVLASGKRLEPQRIEILDDGTRDTGIRATFEVTGGRTQATYAFHRLERRALLALLERHLLAGEDEHADATALIRIGDIAQQIGAAEDAATYFVRAGALSPALGELRDGRLEGVRRERARALLLDLERDLRAGKRADVLARAAALEGGASGVPLSVVERMRMDALVRLARPGLPAQPAAPVAAQPPVPAKPAAAVAPGVQKQLAAARVHREAAAKSLAKAADPGVSNRTARRLLELAARRLLDARRALIRGVGPVAPALVEAATAVNDELIDTYLQVGELLRQEARFTEARRWLRAVHVLDPENPRATALSTRIEADLHAPLEPHDDPYYDPYYDPDPFSHYFVGSYFGTPWVSGRSLHGLGSYHHRGYGHLHRGLRFPVSRHYRLFGSTRARTGGSRRAIGTRR